MEYNTAPLDFLNTFTEGVCALPSYMKLDVGICQLIVSPAKADAGISVAVSINIIIIMIQVLIFSF